MNYISPKDWIEKYAQDNHYHLIDIREPYECVDCNIACERIPMNELAEHPERLNPEKNNVLMCHSGKRAEALANLIETEFNISNLTVIEGGYTALVELI